MVVLAGLFVLTSHYIFKPSLEPRKIRRTSRPTEVHSTSRSLHGGMVEDDALAKPERSVQASEAVPLARFQQHSMPLPGSGQVHSNEVHKADVPLVTSTLSVASAASGPDFSQPSLANSGLVPYTDEVSEFDCTPKMYARPTRPLDHVVSASATSWPQNCQGREELCDVVRTTAVNREVLVAVCNSNVIGQLSKWVDANRRAKVTNMLLIAIDDRLPKWLKENNVPYWLRVNRAAGSHKISAQKFKYVREFLTIGCSVIMSDIDVVYLQNPFLFLHRDSDVEGTTDGWDDGSAYGWMERLDDPSMGEHGRFRPGMRITAWNSGLWYARATNASLRLMTILAYRMEHEDTWDQAAFTLPYY